MVTKESAVSGIHCGPESKGRQPYLYHPFELAFSGPSGVGKTTLLERLVPKLGPLELGFFKSDAHGFSMDRPGKDTFRIAQAGAAGVGIRSGEASAYLVGTPQDRRDWVFRFLSHDALLLEGFRDEDLPKILVLDEAGRTWEEFQSGRYRQVIALVHPGEAPSSPLPCFHRDDLDGIAGMVRGHWSSRVPRVRALVLAGGRSSRMGRDKAAIRYHGEGQATWLLSVLRELGLDPLLSRAPGQDALPGVVPESILLDRYLGWGPLGGILSAQLSDPTCAWLVVGCDLPHLGRELVEDLLEHRDPFRFATAYLDSDGRFPEPMCSIWEPKSFQRSHQFLATGADCPRKVLINSRVALLPSPGAQALFNANTPSESMEAQSTLAKEEG